MKAPIGEPFGSPYPLRSVDARWNGPNSLLWSPRRRRYRARCPASTHRQASAASPTPTGDSKQAAKWLPTQTAGGYAEEFGNEIYKSSGYHEEILGCLLEKALFFSSNADNPPIGGERIARRLGAEHKQREAVPPEVEAFRQPVEDARHAPASAPPRGGKKEARRVEIARIRREIAENTAQRARDGEPMA